MNKSFDPLKEKSTKKICIKVDEQFLKCHSESIMFECNLFLKKPNHSKFCYARIYEKFMILLQVIFIYI